MSVTTPTVFTVYPAQAAGLASIGAAGDAGRIEDTDIEALVYNATHAYAYNPRTVLEHTRLSATDRLTGTDGTYTPVLECAARLGADRVALAAHYRRDNCDLKIEVFASDGTTLDTSAADTTATAEGTLSITSITESLVVLVVSARTAVAGTWALEKIRITEVALTTSDLP